MLKKILPGLLLIAVTVVAVNPILVSRLVAQITGGTSLTVRTTGPPSTGAFLTGIVVTSDNVNPALSTISAAPPTGWRLILARGFESAMSSFENDQEPPGNSASITTAGAHTGSHSMGGTYSGNGQTLAYGIDQGHIGNFGSDWSELEISYWDWVSPQALYANSDYWMFAMKAAGCNGSLQDINVDAQNFAGVGSETSTGFFVVSQGNQSNPACQGYYQMNNGANLQINAGFWRQYEWHVKPTTVVTSSACYTDGNNNANPGCTGNGEEELYVDGVLKQQILNADLNGSASMLNPAVYVGGVITSCNAGGCDPGCAPFTSCPGPQPGTGAPPAFDRRIDDVILEAR